VEKSGVAYAEAQRAGPGQGIQFGAYAEGGSVFNNSGTLWTWTAIPGAATPNGYPNQPYPPHSSFPALIIAGQSGLTFEFQVSATTPNGDAWTADLKCYLA
jgi:hypothetical protein